MSLLDLFKKKGSGDVAKDRLDVYKRQLLIAVILYKPVTFLNKHLNPTDKRRISKVD